MTGILLIGGDAPSGERLKAYIDEAHYVIAADSGLDLALSLGIDPDLVVGDMDSLSNIELLARFPKERIMRFPHDKDETDTEIGLRVLKEQGIKRVVMAGGGGGRLDHLIGVLILFERPFRPKIWLTAREHIELIEGRGEFDVPIGQIISFFPIGNRVSGLRSSGLRWPLDGLQWRRGDSGISNITTSSRICITVKQGNLLMVRELEQWGRT